MLRPEIRAYYEQRSEETRLEQGLGQIEAHRTKALIERHRPSPPATVLDIGGASGTYGLWLAAEGYDVHLLEPVDRLVLLARTRSTESPMPLQSCEVGDARNLPYDADSADMVLMLGPLYHLPDRDDRILALREAHRVLRPGGWLFAAAITRWASALDGIVHDYLADEEFRGLVEHALETGVHQNPGGVPARFTTAFFHRPSELSGELTEAGYDVTQIYGVEGPARMLTDFEERWRDPRQREDLLRLAEVVETEPSLLGLSGHLLGAAVKPISIA